MINVMSAINSISVRYMVIASFRRMRRRRDKQNASSITMTKEGVRRRVASPRAPIQLGCRDIVAHFVEFVKVFHGNQKKYRRGDLTKSFRRGIIQMEVKRPALDGPLSSFS